MKIALIQPAMGREGEGYVGSWKMEPLSMAQLAALTPRGDEVVFFDDRVEAIDYQPVDLVAITTETYTARRAYQIAARYRALGVPVILGGYHATLLPDEAGQYADSVLVGEAEGVWHQVLADARRGRLAPRYQGEERLPLGGIRPNRAIFEGKNYLPLTLVETGRGCRFRCQFCSIAAFYRSSFRARPPAEVAAEIEAAGRKYVFLVDDNVSADFERTKDLCRTLAPLNIRWMSQATLDTADDPELLKLMEKSGCTSLLIGFESIDAKSLKAMGKGFNQGAARFKDSVKRLHDHGIKLYATFVFGYDADDEDVFERTLDFALEQNFFVSAFNHLQPFPGTPLYAQMEREGRLLHDRWWLKEGYRFGQVVFQPKTMSPEQLYEKLQDVRRRYYSFGNIAKRAVGNWRTNLVAQDHGWIYLAANLVLKKELKDKWLTPLGDLAEPLVVLPKPNLG